MGEEEDKVMGFILAAFIIVGAAIVVSRQLFPFFLVGSIVLFIGTIISLIIEIFFRDHTYLDFKEYVSVYVGGAFLIFIICTTITYGIGYGLGGTSFGQASLEVYNAITGAEEQISEAFDESINQIIETSCEELTEENCNLLRQTASTMKTAQEISDFAEKLKKGSDLVEKVND